MRNHKWMSVFVAVLVLFAVTFTVGCKKKEEAPVAPVEETMAPADATAPAEVPAEVPATE